MHVSNANRVRVGRRLAAACLSLGMIASLAACAGAGPQTAPPLEVTATRTLSVVVSSSGDDAENRADGTITFISPDLELGLKRGQPQTVGLRFTGVQLPRGAKIRRAYVQFTADEAHSAPARVTIRAEATGSAKPFRAAHHNLAYRAKTRARVVWTPLPWTRAGEAGAAQRTPDLAAVLQEVVDRPDWRSGGSVALLFQGHSGLRVARAFDRHPNAAPRLVIELGGGSQSVAARGVPVIFDTDLGIDVDDAGALAVLHALADRGEARLLATIANVNDPYAAAALGAINTFYGRPDVPVGRNPRPQYAVATPYWRTFAPRFVKDLAERFPHNTAPNPEAAVAVYRRVLAAQPDSSVTLIAVGFLQNLADLLASSPDRYSGLSGEALVRRKVRQLVVMAGTHPGSSRDLYLRGGAGDDAGAGHEGAGNVAHPGRLHPGERLRGLRHRTHARSQHPAGKPRARRLHPVFRPGGRRPQLVGPVHGPLRRARHGAPGGRHLLRARRPRSAAPEPRRRQRLARPRQRPPPAALPRDRADRAAAPARGAAHRAAQRPLSTSRLPFRASAFFALSITAETYFLPDAPSCGASRSSWAKAPPKDT
ncbi:nucleoside hydrolase [Truepera radiovictrix]|uniref:Inosine/uridine-preferring nucleoside hydrolase domain-containing protein n=1 Tax=Truepera radiovictrix (strain DSM 17093 / CIP 108686 / LMG 22925 / RQ-24) TaxID=649638 RepID=D7CXG4_TRURR|nr:nucleoside hydrolase [Truepera radiovictrix]ADI13288.1 hypothetical protein Trad_0146 [Truepera radiovictrix DSM 17093]